MDKLSKNLHEGSVLKKLIIFSLPFLLSNIIQSLYNVADLMIVGWFNGAESIAGVNISGQITFVLTNFVMGLCIGGSVLVAQYLGAKNNKAIIEVIGTLFSTLAIAALTIMVIMWFSQTAVLELMQTPQEAFSEASDYLFITMLGVFFIFGYNALSSIMRGLGDSKTPLIFISVACVINVLLDFLLVGYFGLAATGAAVATVISQATSMLLCIIYLIRNNFIFDFSLRLFKIKRERLAQILRVGIPSSLQNVITGISFLVITAIANTLGVSAAAAVGVVGKFNVFAIMPSIALSLSISSMVAQNIGAGKIERANETFKIGTMIAWTISVTIFAFAQIFPEQIFGLFSADAQMMEIGLPYFKLFTFDYLLVPFVFCFNGLFIGAGESMVSLFINSMSAIILRVPMAILFSFTFGMGLTGMGLGAPIASIGALCFCLYFYSTGKWKTKNIIKV
ncbi:MAG: MATE family efflux transporter [Culicoidibacterales bacterium]